MIQEQKEAELRKREAVQREKEWVRQQKEARQKRKADISRRQKEVEQRNKSLERQRREIEQRNREAAKQNEAREKAMEKARTRQNKRKGDELPAPLPVRPKPVPPPRPTRSARAAVRSVGKAPAPTDSKSTVALRTTLAARSAHPDRYAGRTVHRTTKGRGGRRQKDTGPAWLHCLLFAALSLAIGAAVTVAMESVRAGSPAQMRAWIGKYTDSFLLTMFLYTAAAAFLGALLGRLWIAAIAVFAAGMGLALVDYFKLTINGAPLTLTDFSLAPRAGDLATISALHWPPAVFWQAAADLFLLAVFLFFLDPFTRLQGKAWGLRLLSSTALCLLLFSGLFAQGLGDLFRVDVVTRLDPSSSHNTYGLTVSLWRERFMQRKIPPDGYGEDFMADILNRVDNLLAAPEPPDAAQPAAESDVQPNIIIVLSESFFDITRLPGLSFDRDPLANFHALQAESISGPFYSHYLGYGTGYIELSMQTGLAGPDLGAGTNICFMDRKIYELFHALPEQYTRTGTYAAEMLHAYDNRLYNRTVTYPLLGYANSLYEQNLLQLDLGWEGSPFGGYYLRDSYLVTALLHELQEINAGGSRAFLYAITMENHQPFAPDKFGGECQIGVTSRLLDDDEMAVLRVGLEGITRADQALRQLTDALRNYPEPTIVAFFGDHRPTLPMPDGNTVYTKLGQSPGSDTSLWSAVQLGELYSSDYLIWANDPALLHGRAGTTKPSGVLALGPDILRLTGQPVSRYWGLLQRAADVRLVSTEIYFVNGRGIPFRRKEDASLSNTEEEILYLRDCVIYDAIYGGQYATQAMNLPPP